MSSLQDSSTSSLTDVHLVESDRSRRAEESAHAPMRLAVVTDHRFLEDGHRTFDDFVFGPEFWDDYLTVARELVVVARRKGGNVDGLTRSDGERVKFQLGKFAAFRALWGATAVVVRLPSTRAVLLLPLLALKPKLKIAFELIGHPSDSLVSIARTQGLIGNMRLRVTAALVRVAVEVVIRRAVTGSYVSTHLRRQFPANQIDDTDVISSIRLSDEDWRMPPIRTDAETKVLNVICVGSLNPVKNQQVAIRAVAKLEGSVHLKLVGNGPQMDELRALASELAADQWVQFAGHVSDRSELRNAMDAADVAILCSTSEGLPRSVVESMARSLPVVASNIPGCRELIDTEYLFEPHDYERLAELLSGMCSSERRAKASVNNYKAAQRFEGPLLRAKRRAMLEKLKG